MGPGHPECPERLDAISDHLLSTGLMQLLVPYDAPQATREQLQRAHTALHVANIFDASPREGHVALDPDTSMCPASLEAALHAAGAAVLATDLVLRGEAGRAFCAVRPPGHHATRDAPMGFCLFNNVAVGIRHALDVHGLKRVALVDFDVHHGNGSEDILANDDRVLMVSTFEGGLYPFSGDNALISLRSRASFSRPLTLIRSMEDRAQQSYLGKIKELEDSLNQTQEKLAALQRARAPGASTILSPEQQAELENFRKNAAETRRELKEVRKDLRADSEALETWTKVINIAAMPLLVAAAGIALALWRRRRKVTL